jgi:hypothetical protein
MRPPLLPGPGPHHRPRPPHRLRPRRAHHRDEPVHPVPARPPAQRRGRLGHPPTRTRAHRMDQPARPPIPVTTAPGHPDRPRAVPRRPTTTRRAGRTLRMDQPTRTLRLRRTLQLRTPDPATPTDQNTTGGIRARPGADRDLRPQRIISVLATPVWDHAPQHLSDQRVRMESRPHGMAVEASAEGQRVVSVAVSSMWSDLPRTGDRPT